MKIILDTNVLISAIVFKGIAEKVFTYCLLKEKTYLSDWILHELDSKLESKFAFPIQERTEILSLTQNKAVIALPTNLIPTICRDADDNNILQLAEFVNADYIVTGDKDLLILETFGTSQIVTPRLFYDTFIVK